MEDLLRSLRVEDELLKEGLTDLRRETNDGRMSCDVLEYIFAAFQLYNIDSGMNKNVLFHTFSWFSDLLVDFASNEEWKDIVLPDKGTVPRLFNTEKLGELRKQLPLGWDEADDVFVPSCTKSGHW